MTHSSANLHLPLPPLTQVMAWGPAVCARNPVLAALHSLFHAFAAEEAQRRAGGTLTGTAARRRLVDPSQLRQALSELPGQQFRAGVHDFSQTCAEQCGCSGDTALM